MVAISHATRTVGFNSHAINCRIMPAVSVIIPTYNRAEVLPRAIESVLEQTYDNFELIIVDDASTDDTEAVINQFDDYRIQYYRFNENRGANAARNYGLSKANGRYVSFLDSDDKYQNERLNKMVGKIEELSDGYGAVFHSYLREQNGDIVGSRVTKNGTISLSDLKHGNVIGSFLAVLFKRKVFEKVGKLDKEMVGGQDYEFYIRVAKKYDFFGISDELAVYSDSEDSISGNIKKIEQSNNQLIERHGDIFSNQRHARHYYRRFFYYAKNNQFSRARCELITAIKYNPFNLLFYFYLVFIIFGKNGYDIAEAIKSISSKIILKFLTPNLVGERKTKIKITHDK